MSSTFTLPELLDVAKEAYECVQVRTIAARLDGTTYNVVTLIQFSTSSPKECEGEMRRRLEGNALCEDGPLRFVQRCLPMTKWPQLSAQLEAGKLRVSGLMVSLGAAVKLETFTSIIDRDFGYIRNPTDCPMFQDRVSTFPGGVSTEQRLRLERVIYDRAVLRQLEQSGFNWFINLASAYLNAKPNNPAEPSVVVVVAPVPAMIHDVEIAPDGRRIRTRVLLHPGLMGRASLKGKIGGLTRETLRFGELIPCRENPAFGEADSEPISLPGNVEVRLVHSILGIVDTWNSADRRFEQGGNPVPGVEGAASVLGADGEESSAVRARAVRHVLDELAKITPSMKFPSDYENVKKLFSESMTFKVCDGDRELKVKLENIAGHQQRVRFAIEIVAANFGRSFYTVEKDWKTHKPRKEKADRAGEQPGRTPKVRK